MALPRIAILGAGGFARELAWLIREINAREERYRFVGYVVSDLNRVAERDQSDQLRGDLTWLDSHRKEVDALALGIGAPEARARLSAQLERDLPGVEWPTLIHPSVHRDGASCAIERGAILCAGVILTVNVQIGPFSLLNLACTVGHEAVIGSACVLNPTVNVSGGVNLGHRVLVGTGAQVLQYIRVGDGATIGAGAVVTKDVPAGETHVGVPAKALRRSDPLPA